MKITHRQLRQIIREELNRMLERSTLSNRSTEAINESAMVGLKPISYHGQKDETTESKWMRIAGINESDQDMQAMHEIAVDVGAESIKGSMTGRGVEAFSMQNKKQVLFYKDGKPVGTIQLPSNEVGTVRNAVNLSNAMKDHGVQGLESADIKGPRDVNKLYVV
jgi:hypothetical protein